VLYVAMEDPTNDDARKEVERWSGLSVRAMIAPPSHIRAAIRAYYGPSQPPDETPSLSPDQLSSMPPAPGAAPAVTVATTSPIDSPDAGPVIEAREVSMPPPRRPSGARMVTLTLLDGTKVNLPASKAAKGAPVAASEDALTARDMVAALRAVAHGADASEILGENVNWQGMFATLLSLLLKKHLIA